jgi:hypothetical protein
MITIVAVNLPLGYGAADQVLQNKLEASENRIAFLEKQIQDIQDNYVSFEALQPVLTDFENYQLEVDEIRNNVNDFNGLWKQLFDYEQKQYNLRGR